MYTAHHIEWRSLWRGRLWRKVDGFKGKDLPNYLFCVVVWSVLVNGEFLVQLEKSSPLPSPAVGEVLKPVELQLEVMD